MRRQDTFAFIFLRRFDPIPSHGFPSRGFDDHTHWIHHTRKDSSGWAISPTHRPLPDNTQHSEEKNIHAPGGIRIHNLSSRATADLRFRPRGYWHRPVRFCKYETANV